MIRPCLSLAAVALLSLTAGHDASKIDLPQSEGTETSELTGTIKPDVDGRACEKPVAMLSGRSLPRVYSKLLALRQQHEVTFLRNDIRQAKELARRIEQIERQFRYPIPAPRSAEPRVHAVGYYSSNNNVGHVKVTDTSSPIVLVLTAYDEMEWAVEADDKVQLDFIVLTGYHEQTMCRVPDGVPVFRYAYNTESNGYAYAYGADRSKWTKLDEFVTELTGGLPICTIFGSYYAPKEPAVIGPANERWRVQMLDGQLRNPEVADE